MTEPRPGADEGPAKQRSARFRVNRTLLLLALVGIAPIVASYAAYYFFRSEARANYDRVHEASPVPKPERRYAGASN